MKLAGIVFLNGERTRQFIAREPKSTYFDKFGISVLDRHFCYGDAISLSAEPEGGKKLNAVKCSVITPDGAVRADGVQLHDDGSHGDARAGDGVWTNTAIYTIAASDPRGQWTLDLTGKTGGNDVRWGFRFIMPGKRLTSADHPRLYLLYSFSRRKDTAYQYQDFPDAGLMVIRNRKR